MNRLAKCVRQMQQKHTLRAFLSIFRLSEQSKLEVFVGIKNGSNSI